ncbi:MAG TPA: VanZ family protein [Opitutaceae bacterium]
MHRARSLPAADTPSAGLAGGREAWCWAAALAITIMIASSREQVAAPEINHFDKLAHFLVYGLLATLVVRTPAGRRRAWLAVTMTSLFGVSDEIHQLFTPGRSVALADWVADTLGAWLAVVLYLRWRWYRGVLEWSFFRLNRRIETRPPSVPEQAA